MTIPEFSNGFDLYYNNITSNQAPGLNEWEKSMFLTKAEKEVTLNHFTANSKGNNIGQGFDDSAKRQADFSVLMKTGKCTKTEHIHCAWEEDTEGTDVPLTSIQLIKNDASEEVLPWEKVPMDTVYVATMTVNQELLVTIDSIEYKVEGFPYDIPDFGEGSLERTDAFTLDSKIDPRSGVYSFPEDTFIIINESLYTSDKRILQVVPLRYDEYTRLMSKPFKRPLKNQAWRLMNSGEMTTSSMAKKYAEIIVNTWDEDKLASYNVRYVRVPKPIILAPFEGLSIDGYVGKDSNGNYVYADDTSATAVAGIGCELDPILHEEILQRAVELAKVAWTATGQDNSQMVMAAGQRSE